MLKEGRQAVGVGVMRKVSRPSSKRDRRLPVVLNQFCTCRSPWGDVTVAGSPAADLAGECAHHRRGQFASSIEAIPTIATPKKSETDRHTVSCNLHSIFKPFYFWIGFDLIQWSLEDDF